MPDALPVSPAPLRSIGKAALTARKAERRLTDSASSISPAVRSSIGRGGDM